MKQEYIHQVGRALPLPGKQKREVLRDLEEIFASAGEHGESEAQVLDRLGSPEEYAKEVLAQTGYAPRPEKAALGLALSTLVCGVCLALFLWSQSGRLPENAIGGAAGSTNIQVMGGTDLSPLLLVAAAVGLVCAVWFTWRLRRKG
ncbi:MAG TPA: DUF1700 domain-containing protein [Candidatus Acutalibacter pullistercoris]|uniref:DUF1700 domain-containing protein n=1 Tax=Candidatus Acutalibacter pullistercoris TaxID=2838418 RepID=A0A9D2C1I0_9FIRM|nr:DUF1700 domain-containing protein [Candidatus Acutalibacter pullistercoris]